jgi:hypothetical protein
MPVALAPLLSRLRALKPGLRERFGVSAISVFGSRARGDAREDSDLDLLLEFERSPTLFGLARLDRELEAALGVTVDTVPADCLHPAVRPFVEPDLIAV